MSDAGINHYTFHSEATADVEGCIRKIREAGMKVTLNPTANPAFFNITVLIC